MTSPDLDQEKARQELELRIQRQIAFASGLFQGDITIRTLLESLAEGVIIVDNSGTILFINACAEQMFGYQEKEIIGKHFSCFYPDEVRNAGKPEEELRKAAADGRVEDEGWRVRKDGSRFWADVAITALSDESGNLRGFSKMTRDITQHKKAEDALRFSEARYRALFRDNPTMIITLDNELTMLSVNPFCASQLGYTIDELEGQSVLKLFHEDDRPPVAGQLRMCLQNPGQVFRWQFRKTRKDGGMLWVEETAQTVYDLGGVLNVLVVCQDITERKRAEEVLRISENKFSKAFQATPSVLVIASLADGIYKDVNEAFERVMGYRRDEVIGRSSLQVNIWQNREERAIVLRMLAEGKKVRDLEIGFRSKSGTIILGLYSAEIIEIGTEQCLLSLVNDITARKKAEEELRHSEERYRSLYNDTPVMLHSIDHDGRLVSVSNYWLETLGYERSEVLGRLSTEFLTTASRSYATDVALPDFFRTGSCKEVPYQFVKKNGEILDVLLSAIAERDREGKAVRSLAVMVDVTDRKRAEEALRKSEKKFLTVFHAVPAMLGITTLAEGRFIDVNETCMRILGYQRDEVIGHTSLEIGMWESHADRARALRALVEHGKSRDIEINLRGKTGESFVGLMSADFIDIDGEKYILSMINDITERKRMEEEIKRLNTDLAARAADLEDANRELEAFNYTVAHDLRQPLNVISSYCQAIDILCGDQLQEECKGYVQGSYDSTLRMNSLIEALLQFSRLTHAELNRDRVDLSSMATQVVEELKGTATGRRVEVRIADGIVANGDANLLRVVLTNLISNAWKFTATQEKGIIEFDAAEIDGKQTCFVRDNGVGFSMTDAAKLFAPFQRLPGSEACKGFGIGLATVERIIRRHGGRVWAESEPGKGTTFYFTLS